MRVVEGDYSGMFPQDFKPARGLFRPSVKPRPISSQTQVWDLIGDAVFSLPVGRRERVVRAFDDPWFFLPACATPGVADWAVKRAAGRGSGSARFYSAGRGAPFYNRARQALVAIGEVASAPLCRFLRETRKRARSGNRLSLMTALIDLHPPEALDVLAGELDHPQPDVRAEALRGVMTFDAAARDAYARAGLAARDKQTRLRAANVLATIPATSVRSAALAKERPAAVREVLDGTRAAALTELQAKIAAARAELDAAAVSRVRSLLATKRRIELRLGTVEGHADDERVLADVDRKLARLPAATHRAQLLLAFEEYKKRVETQSLAELDDLYEVGSRWQTIATRTSDAELAIAATVLLIYSAYQKSPSTPSGLLGFLAQKLGASGMNALLPVLDEIRPDARLALLKTLSWKWPKQGRDAFLRFRNDPSKRTKLTCRRGLAAASRK